jgi:hypothetical protein
MNKIRLSPEINSYFSKPIGKKVSVDFLLSVNELKAQIL